jgi:hypothetical protein
MLSKEMNDEVAKIRGYLEAREMARGYLLGQIALRNNVGPV